MNNEAVLASTAVYLKRRGEWGNVTAELVGSWLELDHDECCKQRRISKCYRCHSEKAVSETREILQAYFSVSSPVDLRTAYACLIESLERSIQVAEPRS